MSFQYIALLALLVGSQSASASRGFFGFCPTYQDQADLIASTHQGTLLMESFIADSSEFNLVAWDPLGTEESNTCYKMEISSLTELVLTYVTGGTSTVTTHAFEHVRGNVPNWQVEKSSVSTNPMNLNGGGNIRWNIVYMSETELAFTVCTQFLFLGTETIYVYSLADLSELTDDCITATVSDTLGYAGTVSRVDRSTC